LQTAYVEEFIPIDIGDNLSAQGPQIINMALDGAFGQALVDLVLDKRGQGVDNGLPMARPCWSIIQLSGHLSRSGT
jgi:hypothetical protein